MNNVGERLKFHQLASGLPVPEGASEEDLLAFEARHEVVLPGDMRACYQVLDGTGHRCADDFLFRLWPLHEIHLDPQGGGWVFADHCISTVDYAIRLPEGDVWALYYKPPFRVAGSFDDFIEAYLADPWERLL